MRTSLKVIAGSAMGFAIAIAFFRSPASTTPPPEVNGTVRDGSSPMRVTVGSVSAELSESERQGLRQLIRDELRNGHRTDDQPTPPSAEAQVVQLTGAALEHYQHVRDRVDEAFQTRTWTTVDRTEVRKELGALPADVRQQIVTQLIDAVNRGEVRWEGRGAVF